MIHLDRFFIRYCLMLILILSSNSVEGQTMDAKLINEPTILGKMVVVFSDGNSFDQVKKVIEKNALMSDPTISYYIIKVELSKLDSILYNLNLFLNNNYSIPINSVHCIKAGSEDFINSLEFTKDFFIDEKDWIILQDSNEELMAEKFFSLEKSFSNKYRWDHEISNIRKEHDLGYVNKVKRNYLSVYLGVSSLHSNDKELYTPSSFVAYGIGSNHLLKGNWSIRNDLRFRSKFPDPQKEIQNAIQSSLNPMELMASGESTVEVDVELTIAGFVFGSASSSAIYSFERKDKIMTPYLGIGLSGNVFLGFSQDVDTSLVVDVSELQNGGLSGGNSSGNFLDQEANSDELEDSRKINSSWGIPFSAGVAFDVNENWKIDFGFMYNPSFSFGNLKFSEYSLSFSMSYNFNKIPKKKYAYIRLL